MRHWIFKCCILVLSTWLALGEPSAWAARKSTCEAKAAGKSQPPIYELIEHEMTWEKYVLRYRISSEFEDVYVEGDLERTGERTCLSMQFKMKTTSGVRVPSFEGQDQYQKIAVHFAGRFNCIGGLWIQRFPHNLNQVNGFMKGPNPLSLEDAARQTWSGQQAAKLGYSEVTVVRVIGIPGYYTWVEVYFSKPE